jgi:hypothetical protein
VTSIAPTQSDVQAAVRNFLVGLLPTGVAVIVGVVNRVSEPSESRFVTIVPIRINRLRTNIASDADCRFTGSVAGNVLTASFGAGDFGTIELGATLFGVGVTDDTIIQAQTSGLPGDAGTYTVSRSQTVATRTLSAGLRSLEEGAEVTVQLDFHSADNTASDLAQMVSAALRDSYGVEKMAGTGVTPLYADDPRYMPFINENSQYEWRWILEAKFQANQVVRVPQQYADDVDVPLDSVEATTP